MLRRFGALVDAHPWVWASFWGVVLAALVAVVADTPLVEAALYGVVFFLAVGFVRSRRRGRRI